MIEFLEPTATAVKFQLPEELNEYNIQVIDSETNEVIKRFLDKYTTMTEMIGLMVDEHL